MAGCSSFPYPNVPARKSTVDSSASSVHDERMRLEIFARLSHLDLSTIVKFKEKKVICAGAYGDVSKQECTFPSRGKFKIAIKRLRFYMKEDIIKLFESEIYVWSKLDHPNILPLLGFAFDDVSGYPLLVSEWMGNGSIRDYIQAHPEADLMHLVTRIAKGLAYLHEKGVVHSDIKPTNILISDAGDVLICDFGCARMVDASWSLPDLSSGLKGTTRYLAYELLAVQNDKTPYSEKTDVWAFGMTIFELLTLDRPYRDLTEIQAAFAIANRELPSLPEAYFVTFSNPKDRYCLWEICQDCWTHDASNRPLMSTILETLLKPRESRFEMDVSQNTDKRNLLTLPSIGSQSVISSSSETVIADRTLFSVPAIKSQFRSPQEKRSALARIRAFFYWGAAPRPSPAMDMVPIPIVVTGGK